MKSIKFGTFLLFFSVFSFEMPGQTPQIQEKAFLKELSGEHDPALDVSAQTYALELQERGVLSHRDLRGNDAAHRLFDQGYPTGVVGEVLGAGGTWESVWAAWKKSLPHAEILLDKSWEKWGLGEIKTPDTTIYVLLFWKP